MSTWYVYQLVRHNLPKDFTLAEILRGMQAFEKEYTVYYHAVPHISLYAWEVELEEKSKRTSSKNTKRRITFAFSAEDEILFSNKILSKKFQTYITRIMHCQELNQIHRLANGTPTNLLMHYKQSKVQDPGALELQYQEKLFEAVEQLAKGRPLTTEVPVHSNEEMQLCRQLGSFPEKIPQIKKVDVDIRNIPIPSENRKLKGYRIEKIDMEVTSPSVFHLYRSLFENGIIKELPPWLLKVRTSGITHCSAHYE